MKVIFAGTPDFAAAALRAIAAKQPKGLAELAAVYGVGEEKAARYGAAVLAVLGQNAV